MSVTDWLLIFVWLTAVVTIALDVELECKYSGAVLFIGIVIICGLVVGAVFAIVI